MNYQAQRIEDNQKFLLKLLHLHIGNYYPLRQWLGISYKGKIDEISDLSFGYNTRYFKKRGKWYKEQTREYQHPDLGYKLNLLLDKIPKLSFALPALLQPSYSFLWLLAFGLTTTTYQPSTKDIYFDSANPNNNFSTQEHLNISYNGTKYNRSIIHFDTTDIPSGATFSAGYVELYCWYFSATTCLTYANRMTRLNWTEGGATWNKYDGTNNWTTAGGDYTTTNRASNNTYGTGWKSWSSATLIQNCYDNQSKNVYLEFETSDGGAVNILYRSRRYTDDTSKRPKLTVTYTAPATSNFFLFFNN